MTSDTQDLRSTRDQPSPDAPRERVQLSAVQVAASALASVSAAVVASLFGVAGTVVGAGLVAIISTTGSALYSSSMKRTSSQLRRARENLLTARAGEAGSTTRSGRATSSTAVLDRPEPGRGRSRSDNAGDQAEQSRWRRGWLTVGSRRGLKWPALVGAVALVFALAIGAITAFEALTNKPISSLTGHSGSSSTTIGSLTGSSSDSTPTPAPTSSGTGSDAGTTSPSPAATSSAKPSAVPSASASVKVPLPSPSAAASNAAPQQGSGSSGSSGSSGDSGSGTTGEVTVPVP